MHGCPLAPAETPGCLPALAAGQVKHRQGLVHGNHKTFPPVWCPIENEVRSLFVDLSMSHFKQENIDQSSTSGAQASHGDVASAASPLPGAVARLPVSVAALEGFESLEKLPCGERAGSAALGWGVFGVDRRLGPEQLAWRLEMTRHKGRGMLRSIKR